jgi:hypothetical protein
MRACRCALALALFAFAGSAAFSNAGSDFGAGANTGSTASAPHGRLLHVPLIEPVTSCPAEATDSLENNDFGVDSSAEPPLRGARARDVFPSRTATLQGHLAARAYSARGPPSA